MQEIAMRKRFAEAKEDYGWPYGEWMNTASCDDGKMGF